MILSKRLERIEFDNKPHLIAFDNGVFNLQTKQFGFKNKNYYMTMTTGYDYNEEQEGIETITELFEKVFPIEDE